MTDFGYDPCPVCVGEKRTIPLKTFRGGVCRTHYRHLRGREKAAEWDGESPILRARDFYSWPLKYNPYPNQLEWLDICQDHSWTLLLAPCDHGKTNAVAVGYAAFCIALNPDIRIGLIGPTLKVAEKTLGAIKAHLEKNVDFIRYFHRMHGFKPKPDYPTSWSKEELVINRYADEDEIKDPTVLAIGKGGELENRRLDLIIPDDMTTLKAAESDVQRDTDYRWFMSVVMTRGDEDCEVKMIGTPEHPDDLYETLACGKTEGGEPFTDFFHVRRVRAVAPKGESHYYTNPDNIATESEYPEDQLKALCPDLMSLKGLLLRARLSHSTFMTKYQCRHSAATDRMFPPGKLAACKDPDLGIPSSYDDYDRNYRMTLMAIDCATGVGISFFTMLLLGISEDYKHVVLNVLRKRIRFAGQLSWIMKWYRKYVPSYVFVESNGQQRAIIDAYQSARVIEGVDLTGIERVAFEPVFTQKSMLLATTTAVSALVDNGGLVFPDRDKEADRTIAPLIKEMKGYPGSSLKDCLMALLIGEAGYSMKFGHTQTVGSVPGVPTIKGALQRRVQGRRQTRYKARRNVSQQPATPEPMPIRGAGTQVSLLDEVRRGRF